MLMTKWMRRAGAIACTTSMLATTTATFAETPLVNTAETKAEVTDVVLGTKGTLMGLVKDSRSLLSFYLKFVGKSPAYLLSVGGT